MTIDPNAVREMAERYAQAWSSGAPEAVAGFYEESGRIVINDGDPIVGRAALTEMAAGFMSAFPGMVVRLDDIRTAGAHAIFVWTLEGRHVETGKQVRVGGWEEWRLSEQVLVAESRGRFDAAEYDRQVAEGI